MTLGVEGPVMPLEGPEFVVTPEIDEGGRGLG